MKRPHWYRTVLLLFAGACLAAPGCHRGAHDGGQVPEDPDGSRRSATVAEGSQNQGNGATFTVRVRIAGLVGLVPSTSGNALAVLAVDGTKEAKASNGCVIPMHSLQVAWNGESALLNGQPFLKHSIFDTPGDWRITAVGGPKSTPPQLSLGNLTDLGARPMVAAPPVPGAGHDRPTYLGAEWVLNDGELYTGSQALAVNDECLRAVPGKGCPIIARLALNRGEVRTCRLTEVWRHATPQGAPRQAEMWSFGMVSLTDRGKPTGFQPRTLATVTEVAWEGHGTGVEVTRTPFGSSAPEDRLVLTPKDGEIVIEFLNLPKVHPEHPDPKCDATKVDFHFERTYELAAKPPHTRYVPIAMEQVPNAQPDCDLLSNLSDHPDGDEYPGDVGACVHKTLAASPDVDGLVSSADKD